MKKLLLILFFPLFFNSSCEKGAVVGGECTYIEYRGYAKIKSIINAPVDESNCPNNPRKIKFEFTPDDILDTALYLFNNYSDSINYIRINSGMNPSQTWIDENGIQVGNQYVCYRNEIIKGTCPPVIFSFQDLNLHPKNGCK